MSKVKLYESYESKLASKCQGVARCLTYNDDERQAAAKHTKIRFDIIDDENFRLINNVRMDCHIIPRWRP